MKNCYVLVDNYGYIIDFYDNINDVLRARESLDEYEDILVLDDKDDIDDVMFHTDGMNNAWFDTYNEFFPCDEESKLKIPIGIYSAYFDDMLEELYYFVFSIVDKDMPFESFENKDMRTKRELAQLVKCDDIILDKLFSNDYYIVF